MKPVLVLQHQSNDSPSYLATWLAARGIPLELYDTGAGQEYPQDLQGYAALAILGGEMSANDPLPSLRRAEHLIREGVRLNVPTLGHCLGGQLMARALGARVVDSPAPEIGWQPLTVFDTPLAQAWLGPPGPRHVFHWHFDAFELPAGAESLASSSACAHQAFALGPHLAMQFHVEIDEAKLLRWSRDDGPQYREAARAHATVSSGEQMRAGLLTHLPAQLALADRIYARWWAAAAR